MSTAAERTLTQKLREQLKQCAGTDEDQLAKDRKKAWDYYFQRPRGDEVPGRSVVVSGDLSAMTEAVLSQMDEAFTTDNIAEFDADGTFDEDQARMESSAVVRQVAKNNGSLELLKAIKNILLLRNGVVKVWVEERRHTVHQDLQEVTLEAFAELTAPNPGREVSVKSYDPETGELSVAVTVIRRNLRISNLSLFNFRYPKDYDTSELQDCSFVAERHIDTRADLKSIWNFPPSKVDRSKEYSKSMSSSDETAQAPHNEQQFLVGIDKSQQSVEWFECYVLTERGRERICIDFNSNEVFERKQVELVPYASGQCFINPGRFTGISLFDKLKQNQDINTGLNRALLDNVNTVNKNRVAYFDGIANADDIADGRTNGQIRVRQNSGIQDVRQAITAFTIPDVSAGILQNIENQRQSRAELGGAALTLATGELQLSDRAGSQGIDRAYSVMEQLSAHMIRNISKTLIRSVFLLAHETMRRNFSEPLNIRHDGRFIETIPAQWIPREDVSIKVGMSPGERTRRVIMFEKMLENQLRLAEQGMDEVLVNLDGFYATMMDWARAGDINNPERYYVDPQSDAAQQALTNKAEQARTASETKQQLVDQAISLEQIRSAIVKYQTDVETQFKYYDANLRAEIEEAKISGNAVLDLLKQNGMTPETETETKGIETNEEDS